MNAARATKKAKADIKKFASDFRTKSGKSIDLAADAEAEAEAKYTVILPASLARKLEEAVFQRRTLNSERGVNRSVIIREALGEYLK